MSRKLRANFLLLTTSFIWGSAFVAQSIGMEHIGPFTFNAVRMVVAGVALTLVTLIMKRFEKRPEESLEDEAGLAEKSAKGDKALYIGGLCCGIVLFFASSFQQAGLLFTTAGKAGFITTLYIIIVPLLGLFLRRKIGKKIWFCVLLALVGLYFLSFIEDMQMNLGDILMLFCAFGYAVHILVIDRFSRQADAVRLSQIQFFVSAVLSSVVMFIFESPDITSILMSWLPILYVGVLSGAVGFTLQIIAQKDTSPTIAALLMSFEAVFAALTGFVILNEILTIRELLGCVLMFAAVLIAQFPGRKSAHDAAS
jgi:drug/metabolite transporter (DMT)-like permease